MKTKLFIFVALFGALFMLQSCDKDEDIIIPPAQTTVIVEEKLQFNQAVYVELDTLHPGCGDCTLNIAISKTITVDSNKVLKIESINHVGTTGLTDADDPVVFPIWVPAGEYNLEIKISGDYAAFSSRQITAVLSGVEYEIIQ